MPTTKSGPRRWIALIALVVGLTASWWQTSTGAQERTLILLLTHVELRLPGSGDGAAGVALDRHELTRIDIILEAGHVHTLHFNRGQAPEATDAVTLQVPADSKRLTFRCRFTLPSGATLHSRGSGDLPEEATKPQIVDVGACAELMAR